MEYVFTALTGNSNTTQTHYVDLWIGSPHPQRQTVIVDTGSTVTAIPCAPDCRNCGVPKHHIDYLFVPSCSATFHTLSCGECLGGECLKGGFRLMEKRDCRLSARYAEWSGWHAYEAQDQLYLGGLHTQANSNNRNLEDTWNPRQTEPFKMKFGCQTRVSGAFRGQLADGIMGMDKGRAALWRQWQKADPSKRKQAFSLCFSRPNTFPSDDGTSAGALSLGGTNPVLHQTPMVFATMPSPGSYRFRVNVRHVYMQEAGSEDIQRLGYSSVSDLHLGTTIIDSGTTDSLFGHSFGNYFKSMFEELAGKEYTTSIQSMTLKDVATYPTLIFQLAGDVKLNKQVDKSNSNSRLAGSVDPDHPYDVLLYVPPEHYFEAANTQETAFASRFMFGASNRNTNVMGANIMVGHDVLFDVDQHVIGWSESTCNYKQGLKKQGIHVQDKNELELSQCVARVQSTLKLGFCVSWSCRLGFVAGLLLLFLCCMKCRRKPKESAYAHLSTTELEMQTPPSALMDDDDDNEDANGFDMNGSYKDDVEEEHVVEIKVV